MKHSFFQGMGLVPGSYSTKDRDLSGLESFAAWLLMPILFTFGILALIIVSIIGWSYGVRQNGVVSGFPERT